MISILAFFQIVRAVDRDNHCGSRCRSTEFTGGPSAMGEEFFQSPRWKNLARQTLLNRVDITKVQSQRVRIDPLHGPCLKDIRSGGHALSFAKDQSPLGDMSGT